MLMVADGDKGTKGKASRQRASSEHPNPDPSAGDLRAWRLGGLQRTVTCNPHAVSGRKVRQFQGRKDGDLAHSQWHPTADHHRA